MATHASAQRQSLGGGDVRSAAAQDATGVLAVLPWVGVGVLMIASALVFWLFDALPFQDLPAHAGLIALRHRFPHSPFEQQVFVVAPHLGPYSLFRALGELLVEPLGPVGTVRAIATLPVAATPLALVWARKRLHGDFSPTAAHFALALGFGFMTLLGFASYLLGVAVLIVGVTVWLELLVASEQLDRGPEAVRRARRLEVAVAFLAPGILVAHGHAFVLFLMIACLSALATGRVRQRLTCGRALVPGIALATWSAWVETFSAVPPGSVALPRHELAPHFQGPLDKLSLLITPTLLTRTGLDATVGVCVWVVIVLAAVATARSLGAAHPGPARNDNEASLAHARALIVSVAGLTAVFFALPHSIGWFGFVDGRLVPVLLLLAILSVRRQSLNRGLRVAFDLCAPAAASAMVLIALVASCLFQSEAAGWREVLSAVPANARLLNLPVEPNSAVFTAHPFVHYDKLVLADRPAVPSAVDWFHQGTAVYPTALNPAIALPASYSESDLRVVEWGAYKLSDWDFVLIRTRPEARAPEVPPSLALEAHRGGWWLFRTGAR